MTGEEDLARTRTPSAMLNWAVRRRRGQDLTPGWDIGGCPWLYQRAECLPSM